MKIKKIAGKLQVTASAAELTILAKSHPKLAAAVKAAQIKKAQFMGDSSVMDEPGVEESHGFHESEQQGDIGSAPGDDASGGTGGDKVPNFLQQVENLWKKEFGLASMPSQLTEQLANAARSSAKNPQSPAGGLDSPTPMPGDDMLPDEPTNGLDAFDANDVSPVGDPNALPEGSIDNPESLGDVDPAASAGNALRDQQSPKNVMSDPDWSDASNEEYRGPYGDGMDLNEIGKKPPMGKMPNVGNPSGTSPGELDSPEPIDGEVPEGMDQSHHMHKNKATRNGQPIDDSKYDDFMNQFAARRGKLSKVSSNDAFIESLAKLMKKAQTPAAATGTAGPVPSASMAPATGPAAPSGAATPAAPAAQSPTAPPAVPGPTPNAPHVSPQVAQQVVNIMKSGPTGAAKANAVLQKATGQQDCTMMVKQIMDQHTMQNKPQPQLQQQTAAPQAQPQQQVQASSKNPKMVPPVRR